MALIDKDVVLNSNPTKRLRIAFENMKVNYNELTAKEYMETYKDQSLAFIIENSRYIFSEPIYGLEFYRESIISNDYALIYTEYENEKEKIEMFIEENGSNMSAEQKNLYDELLSLITEKYNSNINISTIISHACTNDQYKNEYDTFVETVYNLQENPEKINDIKLFIESTNSADLFYALSPYIAKFNHQELDYQISSNIGRFFKECTVENETINNDEWKNYIESIVIVSKLYGDKLYRESVSEMNRYNSSIFEGLATESLKSQIDELSIMHISESAGPNNFNSKSFDCFYSTPYNAVNRIFEDDDNYSIIKEENEQFKTERTKLHEIALNTLFEYVLYDYQTCNNIDSNITGYNYFNENTSIEDAFQEISNSRYIITENEDIDDKDLEQIEDEEKSENDKNTKDIKNDETDNNKTDYDSNNKKSIFKPKDKNLANKIQNKAIARESKFLKKKAESERKGMEVKNAAKAVTAVPKHVNDSIKNTVAEWDKMDDERRKNFIIKPGFRKKYFRNLKLAIMYGAAGSVKLSLLPVVFIARKLSKQKDIRIRNELARELDTNIKVCEEKIADASQENDKEAKYTLMRIKADLEKEALRVKANSKYI